ncbi:MAG: DNA adenine methylase, partial [Clostridia bacterium]|nr:DNA adenine methylase [Clostridia bacterium]
NGKDYLFSQDVEGIKHSMHDYIVYGTKDELLKKEFPQITLTEKSITGRRLEWRDKILKLYGKRGDVQQLEQLERLEQLEQLEQLERITFTCKDYREYEYEDGDIVYCDPPYENAKGYDGGFDHKAFYDWLASRDFPVYFSSYDDISDKRFTKVWAKTKRNLMNGSMTKTADIRIETLYVNHPIDFQFNNYEYVQQKQKEKQMAIFGGET